MFSLGFVYANLPVLDKILNADIMTVILVVFGLGFLSGLSPCGIPTIVLVSNYVGKKQKRHIKFHSFILSLAFVLGIILTLSIVGGVSGFLGALLQKGQKIFTKGTYTLKIFVGIVSFGFIILGLWMLKIIKWGSKSNIMVNVHVKEGSGFKGAFLFGLPFGIAASPCTTPITIAVLLFLASKGNIAYGVLMMAIYAFARSIPILIVGAFTGLLKKLKNIEKIQNVVEKVGGILMIIVGVYFFLKSICRFDVTKLIF